MGQIRVWTLTTEDADGNVITSVVSTQEQLADVYSSALDAWVDDDYDWPKLIDLDDWERALREAGFVVVDAVEHIVQIDTEELEYLAQEARDATYGDSNDREIELLTDALRAAMPLLGLEMPEGRDPDLQNEEDR